MACTIMTENHLNHLNSKSDLEPMEIDDPKNKFDKVAAEKEKDQGNQFYKAKEYDNAIEHYTNAIDLWPQNASYYSNRSAARMMQNKYKEALEDAQVAIKVDNFYAKAYLREAKCHIALGNSKAALLSLQKAKELDASCDKAVMAEVHAASSLAEFEDRANVAAEKRDYRGVVYCMRRALEIAPACVTYKLKRAEYLALMGKYGESQDIAIDILRFDKMNADAVYIRGICLYYDDSIEKAVTFFTQALKLSPDHHNARITLKKAKLLAKKKAEGNDAFKRCQTQKAYDLYTEALAIDPNNRKTNAKLFCNRALVGTKLRKYEVSAEDCSRAIELDEHYVKAYQRRAKCYMEIEKYDEAVYDCQKAFQMEKTRENKELLREAEAALKRSKRKNYYKILGVPRDATDEQIKKAYRKQALVHHPDRHAHATDAEKKATEHKFKEVGEAYAVLSDAQKRGRFDRGEDLDGPSMDFDPNNIFQMFFGGGGGGHSGFSHGSNFGGGSGGGFPGGFTFQFG
ncbi:dnaJ homolog subfamily C member 7-like [Clavelina lepadiformis]|uniref:dnaJ homolog subfamily C member 7-like n=1 Tax=Clavelina lepadiformis TaxID=159417 RepID=UPI0040434630